MAHEIDVNKIDKTQERRAEHLKDKLEDKGLGEDNAARLAYEEVAKDEDSGGSNGGNDAPKHANHQGDKRNGSQGGGG
jgi:hypothetical protein